MLFAIWLTDHKSLVLSMKWRGGEASPGMFEWAQLVKAHGQETNTLTMTEQYVCHMMGSPLLWARNDMWYDLEMNRSENPGRGLPPEAIKNSIEQNGFGGTCNW